MNKRFILDYFMKNGNEWATAREIVRTTKPMMWCSEATWVNTVPIHMRKLAYLTEFHDVDGVYHYRLRPEVYSICGGV